MLAQNGAQHLSHTDHVSLDYIDWHEKNRRVGSLHIDHTSGIAHFVIAFLTAAKEQGFQLIDHHDFIAYMSPTAHDLKTLTLSVNVDGTEYTRRPDRLLALTLPTGVTLPFALEWQSGEVPNRRRADALWRGYRQTSFTDTIWIYWRARNADAFKTVWGVSNIRILTVTESDESVVNLSRRVARITESPRTKLFLFTTPARLFTQNPFGPIWFAPQHAYDGAINRYTLSALRAATPISILDPAALTQTPTPPDSLMSNS